MDIRIIEQVKKGYSYFIIPMDPSKCIIIDPGDWKAILRFLSDKANEKYKITHIFCTSNR